MKLTLHQETLRNMTQKTRKHFLPTFTCGEESCNLTCGCDTTDPTYPWPTHIPAYCYPPITGLNKA